MGPGVKRSGIAPALLNSSLAFALLCAAAPASADSSSTAERSVTTVAIGVHVIRPPDAPDGSPQGNTTVIIGADGVVVVDSCYLPSSAREDIAQIRQWTDRPVRYLVNTHWHNDHVRGNSAYREAFPRIDIVAHDETRRHIAGYVSRYSERFPKIEERYRKMIETRKDQAGNDLPASQVDVLGQALGGRAAVEKELATNVVLPPNLSFDRSFNVSLGDRDIEMKFLGRGNTSGDVVAYLPGEKILIAGDLLAHPVPYLGGGYPREEVETLQQMARLDADIIVPGHGDILHDKTYLHDVIAFIRTVVSEVGEQVYAAGNGPYNLDEVRRNVLKKLDLEAWRKKLGGSSQEDRDFFESFSLQGVITAAYAETWRR